MPSKIQICFLAVMSVVLTSLLGGCGSGNKEGTTIGFTRVSEATCAQCHGSSVESKTGEFIYAEFTNSTHFARNLGCQDCHGGGSAHWGKGPIQFPNPDAAGVCSNATCHSNSASAALLPSSAHFPNLTPKILASPVIWDNMTTAAYITSQNSNKCLTCHKPHDNRVLKQNLEWGQSGHAAAQDAPWIHYDFKARTPCNRCHTTTGYIKFVTTGDSNAWAAANSADKTKEVLRCDGCHQDYSWKRRPLAPVQVIYTPSDGSSSLLADYGDANICINCHAGLESGIEITNATSIATNFGSFNSHYLAAAGLLFRKVGYLFSPAVNYAAGNPSHIAQGGSGPGASGPCVECHMGNSAASTPDPSHRFLPVFRDANNLITSIDAAPLCSNCHTGVGLFLISPTSTDAASIARLQAKSDAFDAALVELRTALQNKGIFYQPDFYPYFFKDASSNHGSSNYFTAWPDKNTLGAAFNLNTLFRAPGSYAHSHLFAYELIFDSLDWLDNGVLDNSPATSPTFDGSNPAISFAGRP